MEPRLIFRVGTEATWVVTGQVLAALGALVGIRILTEFLSPQSYGELALGLTAVMLLQQTAFAGPGAAALRFFSAAKEKGEFPALFSALLRITARRLAIAAAIALCAMLFLMFFSGARWLSLAAASFTAATLSSLPAVLDGIQNAARQRIVVAWHQAAAACFKFAAAVAMIAIFGSSSSTAMWGYALAAAAVLISQSFFFRLKFDSTLRPIARLGPGCIWQQRIHDYSYPFSLWGITAWLQMASDRWALGHFAGAPIVGIYAIIYQLGFGPIIVLAAVLLQLISPLIFAHAGSGEDPERNRRAMLLNLRLSALTLIACLILVIAASFFHAAIFRLLVAEEYRQFSGLLPLMLLSGGLFATAQVASLALLSATESRALLIPKTVTCIGGTVLNIAGAFYGGLAGAIAAGVVFSLSYLVWVFALIFRQWRRSPASA